MGTRTNRECSKGSFAIAGQTPTIEEVNMGSFQRIADSLETIAKDKVKIEDDLAWYKRNYANRVQEIESLKKQVSGQKANVTKLKKQIFNLKNQLT